MPEGRPELEGRMLGDLEARMAGLWLAQTSLTLTKRVSVTAMAPSLPAWFRDMSKADDEDKTIRKGGDSRQGHFPYPERSRHLLRTLQGN